MKNKFGHILYLLMERKKSAVIIIDRIDGNHLFGFSYYKGSYEGYCQSKITHQGFVGYTDTIGLLKYLYLKYIARKKVITREQVEKYANT